MHWAPPLPDYGRLPDFSLTDHLGQPFTREGLTGTVWIADFIFTRCAGQCPLMSAQMAKLQGAFAGLPKVQLVSFSVDASYDTPPILAAYAVQYDARADRWHFVSGNPEAVAVLARQGFHLGVGEGAASAQEPITHSVRLVLVDQQGHVRGYYPATEPAAITRLTRDARRLLKEPAS